MSLYIVTVEKCASPKRSVFVMYILEALSEMMSVAKDEGGFEGVTGLPA
ncbi:hypothetical protein ACVFI8_21530 [Agarivorans sp. MS3-6]|nr:hypothetical protein [Agarivorans sp. TSD2052]UPW20564.1 hypothetical protein M0C34_10025 [Agarivorans sp. TSD2052]